MKRISLKLTSLLLSLVVMVLSAPVWALPMAQFEQATVLFESQESVHDYRLTLGVLKKANSRWRAEREQRLSGQLERTTLELMEGQSEKEAFEFYRRQLLKMGGQELFFCEGRRCGSSNAWANTRFGIKQLYGQDRDQYYSALVVAQEDGTQAYVALYAVRRGNQRSYVQLDVLTSSDAVSVFSSSEVIVERLRLGQAFVLPQLSGNQLHAEQLEAVVEALRWRRWHIAIVGYDVAAGSLTQQRQRSLAAAQSVQQQLLEAGMPEDSLQAFGLGSLSPQAVPEGRERSISLVKVVPDL